MRNSDAMRKEATNHANWGKEVKRLAQGDLSIDGLVESMTEVLLKYVNSRVVRLKRDGVERHEGRSSDQSYHRYYDQRYNCLSSSDVARFPISDEMCLSDSLSDRVEEGLQLTSGVRDAELTTRKLQVIFKLITDIQAFKNRENKAGRIDGGARNKELQNLKTLLTNAEENLSTLDRNYATRHHIHVPGFRLFGCGSFFQSGAQNAVRDAFKSLGRVQAESEKILNAHKKDTEFEKAAVNFRF